MRKNRDLTENVRLKEQSKPKKKKRRHSAVDPSTATNENM